MQPNLTIIILTYNSANIVGSCLEKINFEKYHVIVVDNASTDNSVEFVRKNFPKAQIIALDKNVGYGNGNNVALNLVVTEFALVLNPDAMIIEQDIEIVLAEMNRNEKVAIAGPIILKKYPLNQEELNSHIARIEKDTIEENKYYYGKINGNFSARILVGAVLFMKISIMKKIGFFDEKIFLYYEDEELCSRVRNLGYQNIVIPDAVAFHVGGESSGADLRIIYKKNWHLIWSKLYWKKIRKGSWSAKRTAIRLSFIYFVKTIFSVFKFNKRKLVINLSTFLGAFAFLVGLGSFKKNGHSRG